MRGPSDVRGVTDERVIYVTDVTAWGCILPRRKSIRVRSLT
jgi:hypothetical protein